MKNQTQIQSLETPMVKVLVLHKHIHYVLSGVKFVWVPFVLHICLCQENSRLAR